MCRISNYAVPSCAILVSHDPVLMQSWPFSPHQNVILIIMVKTIKRERFRIAEMVRKFFLFSYSVLKDNFVKLD